jgi:hypothetical protein
MQVQFQRHDVHLAFQKIQLTNAFTIHVDAATPAATIDIPAGRTLHLLRPVSWRGDQGMPFWVAGVTVSNSVAVVHNLLIEGDSFPGPLSLTFTTNSIYGEAGFLGCLVTCYFTEEFATIPEVGAIQVPAGKSQIQVEKSDDLQNWRTVFFNQVPADTRGFYRLKATK